jgi:hypothetical protein
MTDKECIPASLRIGATPVAPRHEVPFDVLLRGININYGEWITNSPHCDPNDTRNLIISMKVALERMQQERDTARREVCRSRASCIKDKQPEEIAAALEWDCFKDHAHA